MIPDMRLEGFAESIHDGFQLTEIDPNFNVTTVFGGTVGIAEEIRGQVDLIELVQSGSCPLACLNAEFLLNRTNQTTEIVADVSFLPGIVEEEFEVKL